MESERCWCGAHEWRLTFRTPRFGLIQCGSCGCYRTDPPPLQDDCQAVDFYTEYYAQGEEVLGCSSTPSVVGRVSRFWRVAEQAPEVREIGRLAVDIGCGDGRLCAELQSAAWPEVVGLEVSRSRIAKARRLYPGIRFCDRPIGEAGLVPDSVDLMVMDNVIEHLPGPAPMLSQLREYLAPHGALVVITPNMQSGNFRLLGRRWTQELAPHAHIFLFSPRSLRRLLSVAGYRIKEMGSFVTPLAPWEEWTRELVRGRVKDVVWRAMQSLGDQYGRLIGAGAMLYAVAERAERPGQAR